MTAIDPLARLFGIVRQELRQSARSPAKPAQTAQQQRSLQAFAQTLAQRIHALDDCSLEQRTALFIKSLLAWEFGYQVLDDREHHRLSETINRLLQEDAQIRQRLQTILSRT